jgi:glycosyltransferase involved in cell wall biosynthesis
LTILHTESSTGWGGQEIRIHQECLGLTKRGHRMHLLCSPGSGLAQRARQDGLPVHAIPLGRGPSPGTVAVTWRILRRIGAELVHTHSSADGWIGGLAARLAGVPVVRTRHLSVPLRRNRLSRLVYTRLADRIITTAEAVRELLLRELPLAPERVVSIPTGIDLARFDPARAGGEALRRSLGLAEAELVGMVAVLRSWKGHARFVEAFPAVLARRPAAHLVLAGDGPLRASLEASVAGRGLADRVHLLGHREDVPEVLAALDVVLSASTGGEGVPQALLQALAMRRPVAATDAGGTREVIRDGETGLLVPAGDAAALAERAARLLEDRALSARLAAAGQALVRRAFGLEGMLDRVEAVYREVLRARCSVLSAE